MKVATWNVNSIRLRMPRLLAWLERRQRDIVSL
jgi:exodeoxyribonuclease-3